MIVKILQKSQTYKGVSYNINKADIDKGELMKVSGFGALAGLDHLRPSDYINYLEAISARSSRIKYPQFHAVISCKGRSHTKEQLTQIADAWLKGMGYGQQPYLLMFHKDTANNHIHMVSTRIDASGKKINDSFEKIRAYKVLAQVLGQDNVMQAKQDIEKVLNYSFSTRPQFMLLLEALGYSLDLVNSQYQVSKFGTVLDHVDLALVDSRIAAYQKDKARIAQLRAIFEKYLKLADGTVHILHTSLPGERAGYATSYSSAFARLIHEKFGVELIFHGKDGKLPYGFSILDHNRKIVMKGSEVMDIRLMIGNALGEPVFKSSLEDMESRETNSDLSGALKKTDEIPDVLEASSFDSFSSLDSAISASAPPNISNELEPSSHDLISPILELSLDIADDIDDEQILGRNRRRKRKARTNTR